MATALASLTHELRITSCVEGLRPGGRGPVSQCVRARVSFPPSSPLPICHSAVCSVPPCSVAACCRPLQCEGSWSPGDTGLSTLPLPRSECRCGLPELQICKNIQFYDLKYISLGCTEATPLHTAYRRH